MDSTHLRRASRAAAATFTAAALTVGGIALAAPASAAENDVVAASGSLDWGYKASFRNYVSAGGAITASDGAERNGAAANAGFLFPVAGGHVTDADTVTIDTTGAAQFTYTAHFFDVKLSNLSIVVDGDQASIVADTYVWAGIDFGDFKQGTYDQQDVVLADIANAVVTIDGGQVTVAGTGVTVTAEGASANPLYAAGTALDDFTVTADVEEGAVAPEPEPAGDADDISVTLPEAAVEPEPETGAFGWAWASANPVSLGTATESNGSFVASGALNDIVVTDTRAGGAGGYSWELTGKVSDFVSGSNSFTAQQLAIAPAVSNASASVVAGEAVRGLVNPVLIASSSAASSATVSAGLNLVIPNTTPAGDYTATVTITAVG